MDGLSHRTGGWVHGAAGMHRQGFYFHRFGTEIVMFRYFMPPVWSPWI